jgi:sodium-dependent phosphate transporter
MCHKVKRARSTEWISTFSSVYKGAPSLKLNELSASSTAAAIVGSAAVVALLAIIFWLPFVHAKVVKKDYSASFQLTSPLCY